MSDWQPIDSAPQSREMIVVRAINTPVQAGALLYTSDPYVVWWDEFQKRWARWPHNFEPTHWVRLPPLDAPCRSGATWGLNPLDSPATP